MPIDVFLPRLYRVRELPGRKWSTICPVHDDRSPSLSVRELADGTLLLRCFAGCGAGAIVAALGLSLRDLFPAKPSRGSGPLERRPRNRADVERLVRTEAERIAHAEARLFE